MLKFQEVRKLQSAYATFCLHNLAARKYFGIVSVIYNYSLKTNLLS